MYEFGKFRKETTMQIRLGIAFYNQGFFNIRVQYSDLFGDDKSAIKIQLGKDSQNYLTTYVNRTANINQTPRIMGGTKCRDWFQSNFNMGDSFNVTMLAEDHIVLH